MLGSPYIPVDSWVYPAVLRLYSLGFVDNVFLGMRPWTRASLSNMLEEAGAAHRGRDDDGPAANEAQGIYEALNHELRYDTQGPCGPHQGNARIESVYTVARAISGTPLRDSYHLGSTIVNDYGRPYENGFNNYSGASGYATAGRFLIYARGEFQGAPSATGYSAALAAELSSSWTRHSSSTPSHGLPYNQATIPLGPIGTATKGGSWRRTSPRHFLNHEISFGKQDDWLGPGHGWRHGLLQQRRKHLRLPHQPHRAAARSAGSPDITGPFRYEFLVGSAQGPHVYAQSGLSRRHPAH